MTTVQNTAGSVSGNVLTQTVKEVTAAVAGAAGAVADTITKTTADQQVPFHPMLRTPERFPLSTAKRPAVPAGVGAFSTPISTTSQVKKDERPGASRKHTYGNYQGTTTTYTPPPPKPNIAELMEKLPEAARAPYAIPGRHDILTFLMAVAVYSDEDFNHAIKNTPYSVIYRCYIDGSFLVHIKRQFGTYLRMPVKYVVEDKTFKPRFKAGEGTDNLANLSKELTKNNLSFGKFADLLKASGVSPDNFYKVIGHEGFKGDEAGTLKRELDLAGYFPNGRRPSMRLLKQVVKLFREVCKRGNSALEAHIMIVWVPETKITSPDGTELVSPGRYEIRVPTQRVSAGSVSYEHDAYDPATELCVLDIHSHNNMSAFYSGTDNNDDKHKVLITGVVGKLSSANPEIVFRMNRLDDKFPMSIEMVFSNEEDDVQIDPAWLGKIQTGYSSYGGNNGGNVTGFRGGRSNPNLHSVYDDEVYAYGFGNGLLFDDDADPVGGTNSKKEIAGAQANVPALVQKPNALQQTANRSSNNSPASLAEAEEEDATGSNLSEEQFQQFLMDTLQISAEELVSMAKSPSNVTERTWTFMMEIVDNEITDPVEITHLMEAHFGGQDESIVSSYAFAKEGVVGIAASDDLLVKVIKEASQYLGAAGQIALQNEIFGRGV